MERVLIDKLTNDLKLINFDGAFCLCGYGEPLLHNDHDYIINKLGEIGAVEIITNGDTLNVSQLKKFFNSRTTRILISLYDGPKQLNKFKNMISEAKIPEDFIILRDRWYSDKVDYGVKLTNRTGTVQIGNQPEIDRKKKCFYPSYQVLIDWNGDFFLCPQDWQRRRSMGNIMQKSFFEIWNGSILNKFRKNLLSGKRCESPCKSCNADGEVYGSNHARQWRQIYKI